jgi:HK97 family phage major capsid protein
MLKQLILNRKLNEKRGLLEPLMAKRTELAAKLDEMKKREAELESDLQAEMQDEEQAEAETAVNEFVAEMDALEAEISENDGNITELETAINELQGQLDELNNRASEQAEPENAGAPAPAENERSMNTMSNLYTPAQLRVQSRREFITRSLTDHSELKTFAENMRSMIGQKRAINGGQLTIPNVMLPMIREIVEENSLMLPHVNRQTVGGVARQVIMGTVPEAIWTEMCGKLNEIDLTFNDTEVDGYKVGAFVAICNALKEDNDVELVFQIIHALARAEALAVDKAILYGTGTKMPLGIVTRLAQTAQPDDYRATARPWADLHTSNIISITSANSVGLKLYQAIIAAFGAAKKKYSAGGKFWAMNEATHMKLVSEAMSINAAGAIVSGMNNVMPILGGDVVELDFIPANVIIAGYGMNYLVAERAGRQVAQSEHYRFIEDQTVFKATARYDGQPVIAESFVAIAINGGTVDASAVTFAADTANA